MNDILGVILVSLFSEVIFKSKSEEDVQSSDDDELTPDDVFKELHRLENVWSSAYFIFERIMNLGIKELYYKDVKIDNSSSKIDESPNFSEKTLN
jgi:hypothetical protein